MIRMIISTILTSIMKIKRKMLKISDMRHSNLRVKDSLKNYSTIKMSPKKKTLMEEKLMKASYKKQKMYLKRFMK